MSQVSGHPEDIEAQRESHTMRLSRRYGRRRAPMGDRYNISLEDIAAVTQNFSAHAIIVQDPYRLLQRRHALKPSTLVVYC